MDKPVGGENCFGTILGTLGILALAVLFFTVAKQLWMLKADVKELKARVEVLEQKVKP